ncbi:MAG TPA: TolC family protein [Gemmatimonadaceae bacterium]|nr:TolC family protein [Gemmatimonadaceae bacterium]
MTTRPSVCLLAAVFAVAAPSFEANAQQRLALKDAVAIAQRQSLQASAAQNTRDAARARDRWFSSTLLPQFSLGGDVPIYNRSIIAVTQPDGSTLFRPQEQNQAALTVNATQRLPYIGGELFLQSALSRVDRIGASSSRTWQSTPLLVGMRQSILRPNTASWDAREQDIRADAAERAYAEAREDVALTTVNAYFDYYAAQVALRNATSNVDIQDSLYVLNKGRFEVGKIGENDLLQSELGVLNAKASLDAAKLEHDRTLAALLLQLNLPQGTPLSLEAPVDVPNVATDTAVAVAQALRNRAQIRDLELQESQARRRVSEIRWSTGFGATLQASMGFNQTGTEMNAVYRDLLEAQRFSLSVQMPLLQWGGRGAQIQEARANESRTAATAQLARAQLSQEAHFAALQLPQAARQLTNAAKADTVATLRFEVARNRYSISRIPINDLFTAQNDKDRALTSYVQALRGYWTAYYRLRRVTLFDFETGATIFKAP